MTPGLADNSLSEPGPVEAAVRSDVEALISGHPMGESLAEIAYLLAGSIDGRRCECGDRVVPVNEPGLARELRDTLSELAGMQAGDGDDFDEALSQPTPGSVDE